MTSKERLLGGTGSSTRTDETYNGARDGFMDWVNAPSSDAEDMGTFGGFLRATGTDLAKIPIRLAAGISEFFTDTVGQAMQLGAYPALKWGSKETQVAAVDWLDAMEKAKDMIAWGTPDRRRKYADDGKDGYYRTFGQYDPSSMYDLDVESGLANPDDLTYAGLLDEANSENVRTAMNAFDTSTGDIARSLALGVRDFVTMPLAVAVSSNPDYWLDDSAVGTVMNSLLVGDGALERKNPDALPNSLAQAAGFMGPLRMKAVATKVGNVAKDINHAVVRAAKAVRQDTKGGSNYTDLARGLFAGDDVPDTIFGIPVVSDENDYTDADLTFFAEHPEAGGFYQMGDETEDAWGNEKGGPTFGSDTPRDQAPKPLVRWDGAIGAPRNWIQENVYKALGRNKFGGTIDYDAEREPYYFRDAAGKVAGYGTTRSITINDGDGYVVIPTIVNGELLSDEDAVKHYQDTGEYWAWTADEKSGNAIAQRIHKDHEARNRKKWNEYILTHWDDMADSVRSDKWLAAEHRRRTASKATKSANVSVNSVETAVSPVRQDVKGGRSPYENAETAIREAMAFIKEHEGFREKAYWDKTGQKWTIGHGHTRIKDPKTGKMRNVTGKDTMDEATSSALVEQIVRANAAKMYRDHKWSRNVGPGALAAMYDVMYNAGANIFDASRSPTLNSEMESADMDFDNIVWQELPTYVYSGGQKLKGLVNRRNDAIKKWKGTI